MDDPSGKARRLPLQEALAAFRHIRRISAEMRRRCESWKDDARAERHRLAVQRRALAALRLKLAAQRERIAEEREALARRAEDDPARGGEDA